MDKNELLKYLICEIDLVMHDKDYRFENEDGTWYSRESCKNLTNEEVFEELKSELRQLAQIEDDFADLEAKLAESERDVEEFKKLAGGLREELIENDCMYKKEIDQLKQQLASQRNEIYETVIKAMTKHWEDIMSKSGWWLNCGKCKDMEKFFKSVIIDNKIPLTRQEAEINFIIDKQIKELKGDTDV